MPLGPLAQQYRMRMWNAEGGGAGGAGSDSQGGESDSGNTGETKTYSQEDIDKLTSSLTAARGERDTFKSQMAELSAKLTEIENKSKPEIDVITGERDDFKTKYEKALTDLRDANARVVVTEAARDAKAISPNAVYAMIAKDLEYDDSNQPTNVADLIAKVQGTDPDLFREIVDGSGDGGAGNSGATQTDDMNSWIRELAGH